MKKLTEYFLIRLVAGLLIVAPIYLAIILLLKAMKSIAGLVKPFTHLVPAWLPADQVLSLLLVLVSCFFIGLAVRTPVGQAAWERLENSLFQRLPGYALLRSLTQRLAGETRDQAWKPALAEIEDALVPAFIIEELEDGRLTIFVPSVPTPLAGAVYILSADRVHALNIPFTQAVKVISRWGSGSSNLSQRWSCRGAVFPLYIFREILEPTRATCPKLDNSRNLTLVHSCCPTQGIAINAPTDFRLFDLKKIKKRALSHFQYSRCCYRQRGESGQSLLRVHADFYQPILSEPIFRSVCLVGPRTFCPIQHIREVDGS